MLRCLELAKIGLRAAMPNPSVGAVIVHNNDIIGEGFTSAYGGPHAEVNAINSVKDKSLLIEATIYVTLEPCSHFGKTPPCADLLAKHKFKTVVIGTRDPNPIVTGNGIRKLRAAGCEVIIGVEEKKCIDANKRFFTFQEKKRPYIVLKWAKSADGFIDKTRTKDKPLPTQITSKASHQLVHQWRSEEMAIMVGTNTALLDNPSLTVRHVEGLNPIRIVIDREGKLPDSLRIFDNQSATICFSKEIKEETNTNQWIQLPFEETLSEMLAELYQQNIISVFVEGGQQLLQSFIDANLWDEARVFTSSENLKTGIHAPTIDCPVHFSEFISSDTLDLYYND